MVAVCQPLTSLLGTVMGGNRFMGEGKDRHELRTAAHTQFCPLGHAEGD
jgi:hypothetical protein